MTWDLTHIPDVLRPALAERLARLDAAHTGPCSVPDDPNGAGASLPLVWACSDFVADACLRDAGLLNWLFDG